MLEEGSRPLSHYAVAQAVRLVCNGIDVVHNLAIRMSVSLGCCVMGPRTARVTVASRSFETAV